METITVTALGFADDIILIADKPLKLQIVIDICEKWSRQNRVQFNGVGHGDPPPPLKYSPLLNNLIFSEQI